MPMSDLRCEICNAAWDSCGLFRGDKAMTKAEEELFRHGLGCPECWEQVLVAQSLAQMEGNHAR